MQMSLDVPEGKTGAYDPCLVSITTFYIQRDHNRDYYIGAFSSQRFYSVERGTYRMNLTNQVTESQKDFLASERKDLRLLAKVGVKGGIDVSLAFEALAVEKPERRFYMSFSISGIANTTSLTLQILLPQEATVERANIDKEEFAPYPLNQLECQLQTKPNEPSPIHQAVIIWVLPPPPPPWYEDPFVRAVLAIITFASALNIVLALPAIWRNSRSFVHQFRLWIYRLRKRRKH